MRFTGRPGAVRKERTVSDAFAWYVGIDWGSAEHALCLLDASGQVCGERRVAHTATAVQEAIAWIGTRTGVAPAAIAVATETPRACSLIR